MAEQRVSIPVEDFALEGLLDKGMKAQGIVLCHPHSLYGGNMDNHVVSALQSALSQEGWGTLRFNFRGVGRSGGQYAEGEGEARDVLAAMAYLQREREQAAVHVAGYSFGAWVVLKALKDVGIRPESLVLVSPPVDFLPFDTLTLAPAPTLITLGDEDSFASLDSLNRWLEKNACSGFPTDLAVFPQCDHFYGRRTSALAARVREFLLSL